MRRIGLLVVAFALAAVAGASLTDGIYSGTAAGHNGPLQVAVIVRNGRIYSVEVVRHKEKRKRAVSEIPRLIVDKQSTDVDAVSGATYTSKAIVNAVNRALKEAQ